MRHPPIFVIIIVGLVTVGCDNDQQDKASQNRPVVQQHAQQEPQLKEPTIPDGVSYSIIKSNILPNIKRSLDIRLNKKVSQNTLRAIALELKSLDSRHYDRTFINYYLPEMAVGAGAWATTHFNPDLEVKILGLTAEEEGKLTAEPTLANREIIGRWLDETPSVSSRITIFREEGKLFFEQAFKDGSVLKRALVQKKSPLGYRFEDAEGSRTEDHWIIGPDGDLQIRDNYGLVSTAKKVK